MAYASGCEEARGFDTTAYLFYVQFCQLSHRTQLGLALINHMSKPRWQT
jgi:hypothetical protein